MSGNIVAFREPLEKRFGDILQQLDCCPWITPTNPGVQEQAWRAQVKKRCPTDKGIYVFYADKVPQYVGRTNHMVRRISGHRSITKDNLPRNSATFARIIAREAFRVAKKRCEEPFSLKLTRSFNDKGENPQKDKFLIKAIQRVRQMQVKVVELPHPHDQTIFEVYVHEMWNTPYNSFRTH